jgi:hypothetical protein
VQGARESLALAAHEFPAVVDLSQPLDVDSVFLEPTLLHEVMQVLASWRDGARWQRPFACAAALQRQLRRCMPEARIDARRWLGATRADGIADLILDGVVALDVQVGLDATRLEGVLERVRGRAPTWGDRPIVIVAFQSNLAELATGPAADALGALREAVPVLIAVLPAR